MVRCVNECVGCPKEMGCMGSSCPYKEVPVFECDECKNDTDKLSVYEGKELCWNCFISKFTMIEEDIYLVGDEKVYIDDLENYCEEVIE